MAPPATTRVAQETACTPTLLLAFALGVYQWPLGCTPGAAPRPRERHVPAGDGPTVLEELRRAQRRFGWPEEARVVRCYAAGRDGFWLHRFFLSHGVENAVVDSVSLEVHCRYRRAKPDRLDVPKLLTMRRHAAGDKQVWRVVRGPSVAEEDRRPRHRELLTTKRDQTRVINRSTGLLAGYGMRLGLQGEVESQGEEVRPWDGSPRPAALRAPAAGVAAGPGAHGANHAASGGTASGVTPQGRAGSGA